MLEVSIELGKAGKSERGYRHYMDHMRAHFAGMPGVRILAGYFFSEAADETTIDVFPAIALGPWLTELAEAEEIWALAWDKRCQICDGLGDDDENWCECPAGEAARDAQLAEFAWMAPLARQHNRAKREGDDELAESLVPFGCGHER